MLTTFIGEAAARGRGAGRAAQALGLDLAFDSLGLRQLRGFSFGEARIPYSALSADQQAMLKELKIIDMVVGTAVGKA